MASVSTYLNFNRNTEEAFTFYQSVFGGEFMGGIYRMKDAPQGAGMPPIKDEDRELVMHVALPILGGHLLMGTDISESSGHKLVPGNNVSISLHPDTRADADRLFAALAAGGVTEMPLTEAFWGDYFGSCIDKFGIHWMVNCAAKV